MSCKRILAAIAVLIVFVLGADESLAATFTVTNTNNSGPGSLRQAVLDANAVGTDDQIAFSSLFDTPQTIGLTTVIDIGGLPAGRLTIDGPGRDKLSISGSNMTRILFVGAGGFLTIRHVRISEARAASALGGGLSSQETSTVLIEDCIFSNNKASDGGAISTHGTVTINDSLIASNSTLGGSGGAISTSGGILTINRTALIGNAATGTGVGNGGAMYTWGTVTLNDSLVQGNTAAGGGGGLYINGNATITNSLIVGNSSQGGGGIFNRGVTVSIINTTISGNTIIPGLGSGSGAGIAIGSLADTTTLQNVTIAFNSGQTAAGLITGDAGNVSMRNTLIAKNVVAGTNPDVVGTINSQGYNLIGNSSGATIVGVTTGNQLNVDPLLASIAFNGGRTRTHALRPGSPAMDAGHPANFAPNDQRGIVRPKDGDGNGTSLPDIGAFERDPRFDNPPFDFDGDGKTDIGIFRPTAGASEWWINRSGNGQTFALQFGASTDKITPADYTGDGKADIAFFRPASGEWYVLRSEDFSFFALPFGANGDVPVPADYDADGKADFAVFRPSSSTWFLSQSSGAPTQIVQFGIAGDQPVPADYDGDGKADVGVFRPAASGGEWWINRSTAGSLAMQFGAATDKAVQGDYTGDGKADIAIWRPATGEWYIVRSEDSSFYGFPFGANGDTVAPSDYDGDGKFDPTVFRPSSATWFIARTTAGTQIVQFGATGDQPVANSFVP